MKIQVGLGLRPCRAVHPGFAVNLLIGYSLFVGLRPALRVADAQSFFASRGLGEEQISYDALQSALGKAFLFSYENPSFPLNLKSVLTLGNINQGILYGKEDKNGRLLYNIKFNYLKILIPLPFKTKIGLSLRERFSQDFDVYSETSGIYYWHITGKGGINSLSLAFAKQIQEVFSLGVAYDYLFGGSEEVWSFETEEQVLTQETIGGCYRGGVWKFTTLGRIKGIQLGAGIEFFRPLKYIGLSGMSGESVQEIRLSPVYNLGIGFSPNEKKHFSFGVTYRDWRKVKLGESIWSTFTNGLLFSLGFSDYLREKYPLRIGYCENFWYLLSRERKRVGESSINFGTSVRIPKYGFFDFSLEIFYRRGRYLKEMGAKLNSSVRFDEVWQKRKRRWGY